MSLRLRTITRKEHLAFVRTLPSASHMQVPSWGDVKAEWRRERRLVRHRGEIVGPGWCCTGRSPR